LKQKTHLPLVEYPVFVAVSRDIRHYHSRQYDCCCLLMLFYPQLKWMFKKPLLKNLMVNEIFHQSHLPLLPLVLFGLRIQILLMVKIWLFMAQIPIIRYPLLQACLPAESEKNDSGLCSRLPDSDARRQSFCPKARSPVQILYSGY